MLWTGTGCGSWKKIKDKFLCCGGEKKSHTSTGMKLEMQFIKTWESSVVQGFQSLFKHKPILFKILCWVKTQIPLWGCTNAMWSMAVCKKHVLRSSLLETYAFKIAGVAVRVKPVWDRSKASALNSSSGDHA